MRRRLGASQSGLSPERALSQLRRIQHHRATITEGKIAEGISTISADQARIFDAMNLPKPDRNAQLTLL
jgi:hypothetical protein